MKFYSFYYFCYFIEHRKKINAVQVYCWLIKINIGLFPDVQTNRGVINEIGIAITKNDTLMT